MARSVVQLGSLVALDKATASMDETKRKRLEEAVMAAARGGPPAPASKQVAKVGSRRLQPFGAWSRPFQAGRLHELGAACRVWAISVVMGLLREAVASP